MKQIIIPERRDAMVIGLLGLWFLCAAAVFIWFGLQSRQYQTQWQQYAGTLHARFDDAVNTAAPDGLSAQTLNTLAADLEAVKPPTPPQLFGIAMGADIERAKQTHVSQALTALQANLRQTAVFMEYQAKVAAELQPMSLAAAGNVTQIRALAEKWQQAINTIKSLTPGLVEAAHAALLQRLEEAQSIIAGLADIYKSGDEAAFKARYQQLAEVIAGFKPLGIQIRAAATTLDAERATLLATIKQNL